MKKRKLTAFDVPVSILKAQWQIGYNKGYIDGLKKANQIWKESFRKAELRLS